MMHSWGNYFVHVPKDKKGIPGLIYHISVRGFFLDYWWPLFLKIFFKWKKGLRLLPLCIMSILLPGFRIATGVLHTWDADKDIENELREVYLEMEGEIEELTE